MVALAKATNEFYAAVGSRIQGYRKQRGLTQTDLAEAVGLKRSSLCNVEAGRQHPLLHTFVMLAQVLGVSIADLMPGAPLPVGSVRMTEAQIVKQMRSLRDELDRCIGRFAGSDPQVETGADDA